MPFTSSVKDERELSKYYIGFPKGLNTVQNQSLVDDKNLTAAQNVVIEVDGITRRPGSTKVFDEASGTKVYGSIAFYKKSDGTRQFVRIANGRLQYLSGTETTWTEVTSHTFSNIPTTFVQARDKLFIYNGTEALRYWDGSTITEYTQITAPTNLAVTATYSGTYAITSITRSSNTATVTTTNDHGLTTGDYVTVSGANQTDYNITASIVVTGSKTFTYTVANTPTSPATGTIVYTLGGVTSYSYEITAFNQAGETTASTNVDITDGADELSTVNFNALTWDTVANADGYNVYGRTSTGFGRVYLATVYTNSYNDTGSDVEVTTKLAPEANNTGGIKGKYGIFSSLGRQFVAGVTEGSTYHPTRLYYSGTIQYIDSFVGAEYGGGWVDIASNDGGEIVDIKPYKNSVLVWKTNGIYKFYFTSTGLPAIEEITKSHGGCSFYGSQEIDNDFIYVAQIENRIAVMTLGQQQNYVGDQLRTNEISIFYRDDLKGTNRSKLTNIASFRYDSKFGFAFTPSGETENSRGYVIDTRFGGWVYWTGDPMSATHYSVYDDGSEVALYGGSNSDGYMIKLFQTGINDNGSAYTSIVGTKAFNMGMYDIEKIYRNPTLWFKYISGGSISCEVYADGTRLAGTAQLSSSSGGAGVGVDLPGHLIPGTSQGYSAETSAGADVPQELQMLQSARSIRFNLIDRSKNTNWLFMGIHILATPLDGKPLQDTLRTQLS